MANKWIVRKNKLPGDFRIRSELFVKFSQAPNLTIYPTKDDEFSGNGIAHKAYNYSNEIDANLCSHIGSNLNSESNTDVDPEGGTLNQFSPP
jgi:hypothetical protein